MSRFGNGQSFFPNENIPTLTFTEIEFESVQDWFQASPTDSKLTNLWAIIISNPQIYSSESKWTFEKVLHEFEIIEKELALDRSLIDGVPWWDALRYPIFLGVLRELGLLEKADITDYRLNQKRKAARLYKTFLDLVCFFSPRSPLWLKKQSIVIWGHPRRKWQEGSYIDVYVDPFIDLLPRSSNFAVLERSESGHLKPTVTQNLFYTDSIQAVALILYLIKKKSKKLLGSLGDAEELERKLNQVFGMDFRIQKQVRNEILHWKSIYPLMRRFFQFKRPSHFFIVVGAGQEAIISAAKDAGVPTFELQHGSPARGKLNYDYSSGLIKRSFPDFFLSFGEYWSEFVGLPLPRQRVISFGYPYLAGKVATQSNVCLKKSQLLIISQPVHGSALAELAIQISQHHKNKIEVVFKPHPAELRYGEPGYFRKLQLSGVTISDRNSDLYLLFAQSSWQVGVYSTALYEGLCFGVACFVARLPGFEHMKPLIDVGLARLINDHHDVDLDWSVDRKDAQELFEQPSREKVEKILSYD